MPSHAATLTVVVGVSCQAQVSAIGASGATTSDTWSPVTPTRRGPFTVVIHEDGVTSLTCFTGLGHPGRRSSGSGTSQQQSGSVSGSTSGGGAGAGQTSILSTNGPEGDIEHMTVAHLTAASQGAYTLAEGQLVQRHRRDVGTRRWRGRRGLHRERMVRRLVAG